MGVRAYIRAFLTVAVFYGAALVCNYLEAGDLFRVNARQDVVEPIGWPLLLTLWWMVVLHLPLPAYFWADGLRLNRWFSNEFVFKSIFVTWYGCVAVMGFIVTGSGAKYGGLIVAGILAGIVMARSGTRLRRLADYGSTCASFFVFYRVSGEVPAQMWLPCYIGIGLVQCAFLALLELVFAETFLPHAEAPGGACSD